MNVDLAQFRQGSFASVAGAIAGYGLILVAMTLLLFVVPYLVFVALG